MIDGPRTREWFRRVGDWLNTAFGEGLALLLALLVGAYVALSSGWEWVIRKRGKP